MKMRAMPNTAKPIDSGMIGDMISLSLQKPGINSFWELSKKLSLFRLHGKLLLKPCSIVRNGLCIYLIHSFFLDSHVPPQCVKIFHII